MIVSRLLIAAPLCLAGCASLATSPSWTGGGMAVTGPPRPLIEPVAEPDPAVKPKRKDQEPEEIGARHILVMHDDSESKPPHVKRSRDEAMARAKEVLGKLREGADFTEMVREYSDEPGAVERGGSLGVFRREVMAESFAEAAFKLKVGEVSEVIETEFGFHVVQRTR
jgi:hypothetical protein